MVSKPPGPHAGNDTGVVAAVGADATAPCVYVEVGGDDTNPGTSDAPKATVGGALGAIPTGFGTIRVGETRPGQAIVEAAPWGAVPRGVKIVGAGKGITTVRKAFDGDLGSLASAVEVHSMTIDLNGASFSGKGMSVVGLVGQQVFRDFALTNGDGACLYFDVAGGAGFTAVNFNAYRVNAATTTERYAVVIEDTGKPAPRAVPRRFVVFDSEGQCSIDFGSCDNVHVAQSTLGDVRFTPNTREVDIIGCRLNNDMELAIHGHGVSIVGCSVNPLITLWPGCDGVTIAGSYNRLPVVDGSGSGRNNITHWATSTPEQWAPVLVSGGDLGVGGYVRGYFSRSGSTITARYAVSVGTGGGLGDKELRVSLPYRRASGDVVIAGSGLIVDGADCTTVVVQIVGAVDYVRLVPAGSATTVTGTALPPGAVLRFSLTYDQ